MMENNQSHSNGRGGARPGAGRPPGAATKKTREIANKAAKEGLMPLDYLLRVMRSPSDHEDPKVQAQRELVRFEAAKAAAPYCHPRLQAVEHSGTIGAEGRPLSDLEVAAKLAYYVDLARKRKAAADAASASSKGGAFANPQASMPLATASERQGRAT